MAITTNAARIRVESAAKNGTLGAQGVLNADQIKFDTAITTNNGNLETSPTFDQRHVILRRGQVDEEWGLINSVDVDGVTCTLLADWDTAPASGDAYDVSYTLPDVETMVGCTREADSRQWVMTKRLVIGVTTTTFGFLGISFGQILRLDDRGNTTTDFQVNTLGHFAIGTLKQRPNGESVAERGGVLLFDKSADNEPAMDIDGVARMYEFSMYSIRSWEGIRGLTVTHDAGADVQWSRFQAAGMDTPYKKKQRRFHDVPGTYWGTVKELKDNMESLKGWCKGDADESVLDSIDLEPDGSKVYLVVED